MARRRLAASLVTLLAMALTGAAVAPADVVDDNPAAVSRFPGDVQVFARGGDGAIHMTTRTAGGWSNWTSLGGQTDSGPAAVVYRGEVLVFARGPGGELLQRSATTSTPWVSLGGELASAPAATTYRGTDRLFVFARRLDDAVWYRIYAPDSGWGPWTSLGGTVTSAPTAISRTEWVIDLFARGVGGEMVQRSLVGNEWLEWGPQGRTATSAPSVTSLGPRNAELFARGGDGAVWRKSWNGSGWGNWAPIEPTVVSSGPAAVADGTGRLSVFARVGSTVAVSDMVGGSWTPWSPLGAIGAGPPCLASPTAGVGPKLTAAVKRARGVSVKRSGKRATLRFGRKARIRGKLRTAEGEPISGAQVCIGVRRHVAGAGLVPAGELTTNERGRFAYVARPGPSRLIRFAHRSAAGTITAAEVRLRVSASASLHATPARLRNGERVRFAGKLRGRPIPRRGVVVELQAWLRDEHRWETFVTTRSNRRGDFRLGYRFTDTTTTRRYRFRARIPAQAAYPYASGRSHGVSVLVRR